MIIWFLIVILSITELQLNDQSEIFTEILINMDIDTPEHLPKIIQVKVLDAGETLDYYYHDQNSPRISNEPDIQLTDFSLPNSNNIPDEIRLIFKDDKTTFWQYELLSTKPERSLEIDVKTGLENNRIQNLKEFWNSDYDNQFAILILLIISITLVAILIRYYKFKRREIKGDTK